MGWGCRERGGGERETLAARKTLQAFTNLTDTGRDAVGPRREPSARSRTPYMCNTTVTDVVCEEHVARRRLLTAATAAAATIRARAPSQVHASTYADGCACVCVCVYKRRFPCAKLTQVASYVGPPGATFERNWRRRRHASPLAGRSVLARRQPFRETCAAAPPCTAVGHPFIFVFTYNLPTTTTTTRTPQRHNYNTF